MNQGRAVQRPRKDVPHPVILMLRPFFRYSYSRDAYVARGVGGSHGPVLRDARSQPVHEEQKPELH